MKQKRLIKELKFCLSLWEKQEHCEFGTHRKCEECGSPYLLWKLITGEHLDNKDLSLEDWKEKVEEVKE